MYQKIFKNQYFECDWNECRNSYKIQMRKRWLAKQEQREARLTIYLEALTNELSRKIFIFKFNLIYGKMIMVIL